MFKSIKLKPDLDPIIINSILAMILTCITIIIVCFKQ